MELDSSAIVSRVLMKNSDVPTGGGVVSYLLRHFLSNFA
jgi:hypothetical protein